MVHVVQVRLVAIELGDESVVFCDTNGTGRIVSGLVDGLSTGCPPNRFKEACLPAVFLAVTKLVIILSEMRILEPPISRAGEDGFAHLVGVAITWLAASD